MSYLDDDSSSLTTLDTFDFLRWNNSFYSSSISSSSCSSSFDASCSPFRMTMAWIGASSRGHPKGLQLFPVVTKEKVCIGAHAMPRPHLTPIPQDYQSSAFSHNDDIFIPLPPIPQVSSFRISGLWERRVSSPSFINISPPGITRESATLHGSPIGVSDSNHTDSSAGATKVPGPPNVVDSSGDPYSPWSRLGGPFLRANRGSQAESGAKDPNPPGRPVNVGTVGCEIPGFREARRLTQNVSRLSKRLRSFKLPSWKPRGWEPSTPQTPTIPPLPIRTSARVSNASSITTFVQEQSVLDISPTSPYSSQQWIKVGDDLTSEKLSKPLLITISGRRGGQLMDDSSHTEHYDDYPLPLLSPKNRVVNNPATPLHIDLIVGKYVSVSLRAGREASRRRKRRSDPVVTWYSSESDIDSLESE